MAKFLEKVSKHILQFSQQELLKTLIVLPNKRSAVFLKNHLKENAQGTFWVPDMLTIDEFIKNATSLVEPEPVNIYYELYLIHKKLAGTDARPFDNFLSWAPVMLSDFNDIDLYLADAKKVFTHLSEIKAVEEWNPGAELTDMQQHYLTFFGSLHEYYTLLNQALLKAGSGYKGMIYRKMWSDIHKVKENAGWNRFVLVGLNALSLVERKIFGFLQENFDVDTLFDADEYYLDKSGKPKHEAGRFIGELVKEWNINTVSWVGNSLSTQRKNIFISGVPRRVGQVKYASQVVEDWIKEGTVRIDADEGSGYSLADTAIVLADEKLLTPFFNSLPSIDHERKEALPLNITMGAPLKGSPLARFIAEWLELARNNELDEKKGFYTHNVLAILNNAFFRTSIGDNLSGHIQKLTESIIKSNQSVLHRNQISSMVAGHTELAGLFNTIFSIPKTPFELLDHFIDFFIKCKPALAVLPKQGWFIREQYLVVVRMIKKLKVILQELKDELSIHSFEKIVIQVINSSEVSLRGEPLSGLQVMGMLETRNLDFSNLIIVSANEGIIPRTDSVDSFIPFDIRHYFGLPLPKDKNEIFAFHFYRLLQQAETIQLVYNTEPDALGGTEKSRYILQLEEELQPRNHSIVIKHLSVSPPPDDTLNDQQISIEKTTSVMERVHAKMKDGLSPTSLASFIRCPLQFYFKYIADLKQPDILEETIQANILGRVIHSLLEDHYKQFEKKQILPDRLSLTKQQIRDAVLVKFRKFYAGGDTSKGQNLLIVETAIHYVDRFIKAELADMHKTPRKIIYLEKEIKIKKTTGAIPFVLTGTIDRVDEELPSGIIRLIDYKTGKVEQKDLNLKNDVSGKLVNPDFSKAFQLLFYTYLFSQQPLHEQNIVPGIISFRNASSGFIEMDQGTDSLEETLEEFESILFHLVDTINDQKIPFRQTEEEDRCTYCDFKNICNRGKKENF